MKAGEAGEIEIVAKVINIHINNVDVCQIGCVTLMVIIKDNGKNTINKNNKNEMNS